jgi:hypothetical protein
MNFPIAKEEAKRMFRERTMYLMSEHDSLGEERCLFCVKIVDKLGSCQFCPLWFFAYRWSQTCALLAGNVRSGVYELEEVVEAFNAWADTQDWKEEEQ